MKCLLVEMDNLKLDKNVLFNCYKTIVVKLVLAYTMSSEIPSSFIKDVSFPFYVFSDQLP